MEATLPQRLVHQLPGYSFEPKYLKINLTTDRNLLKSHVQLPNISQALPRLPSVYLKKSIQQTNHRTIGIQSNHPTNLSPFTSTPAHHLNMCKSTTYSWACGCWDKTTFHYYDLTSHRLDDAPANGCTCTSNGISKFLNR